MTARISLSSPVWNEDEYSKQALATLQRWQDKPPSVLEFNKEIDQNSCSDCVYESFFYLLPYLVDQMEGRAINELSEMSSALSWKLSRAVDADITEDCWNQLQACIGRLNNLLVKVVTSGLIDQEAMKANLGALAAINGNGWLGVEIQRL